MSYQHVCVNEGIPGYRGDVTIGGEVERRASWNDSSDHKRTRAEASIMVVAVKLNNRFSAKKYSMCL